MAVSDRVPSMKETILGIGGDDFRFSSLLNNGYIELTKAAVTAVAIVTPAIKKGVVYMDFLHTSQPANALAGRVVDWEVLSQSCPGRCFYDWVSGNYNYKMGVARIRKIGVSPYKDTFRSMSFARRDIA